MQPNILLVRLDDVGREQLRLLGLGTAPYPSMPHIEKLMQDGVTFLRAYVNPQCSPTRACWETGCRGQQTGVLTLAEGGAQPLLAGEVCLPAAIDAACGVGVYAKALFGKWHLSTPQTRGGEDAHPIKVGYDYYDGHLRNMEGGEDYFSWTRTRAWRTEQGIHTERALVTQYEPSYLVDAALDWIASAMQPWLVTLAPNVPHGPYARPPADLYDTDTWPLTDIIPPDGASLATTRGFFKADLEAFDTELGRLLESMPQNVLGNTVVILWSDNGTSADVVDDAISGGDVKRSTKEFGINTPLIVSGPGVSAPGRQTTALVHATDLWATVLAITQGQGSVPLPSGHGRDSQSFWGVVQGLTDTHRTTIWSEICAQGQYVNCASSGSRALIGPRYKIIRGLPTATGTTFPSGSGGTVDASCALFDLLTDPTEKMNLVGSQSTTGVPPNNTVASPFVSAGIITLTDVHPSHPGALTAYNSLVAAYAAQTATLN